MKQILIACALLAFAACTALAAEDSAPAPRVPSPNASAAAKSAKADGDAAREPKAIRRDPQEAAIEKLLERKVSFELTNTPFNEAVTFVTDLAQVEMLVFHPLTEVKTPLTIKVKDMPMADLLTAICKFADAQWEIRKNRILVSARQAPPPAVVAPASVPVGDARPAYVTSASTGRVAGAATAPTGRDAGPTTASTGRDAGAANRIRVRLANGNEMEAEGGALAQVQSEILEAFFDPAKDGLLVYKLPRQHSAALPALRQRLSEVAAKSKLDYDEILELVTISGTDAVELRRAATLMRHVKFESAPSFAPAKPAAISAPAE